MPSGLPDWFKSVRLTGKYGLQLVPVAVDENGNLYAVIKGTDGTELRTVRLDADGYILSKLVGGTVDVGTISTVEDKDRNIKGYDGADYRAIAVDPDGIMLARLKGFDGSQLRDVLVDDEGRIVGVFKGRYTNPFDLVLDLPFDEGEGSVAHDQSLYGNDGTINGATWTRGRYGYALSFDGSDDYVEIPLSDSVNVSGKEITIVAWVNVKEHADASYKNNVVSRDADLDGYFLRTGTGQPEFGFGDDAHWYVVRSSEEIETGKWYMLVGRYDGEELSIFINGVKTGSKTAQTTIAPNDKNLFVGRWVYGGRFFNGLIDEVRIYSRALTEEEIRELYEGRPTLRVDRNGNLSALLYGKVGNVFKPVELDSLSNLKINISSQELDRIIQRASLGWCRSATPSGTVAAGGEVDAFSVSGAGYFIYAFLQFNDAAMKFSFIFDDATEFWKLSINQMNAYGFKASTPFMGVLEPTVSVYTAYVAPPMPLSFENSFKIRLENPTSSDIDYVLGVYYAVL